MEHRMEMAAGDASFRMGKISVGREGDVYIIPPGPFGTHLSIHASGQMHVRDNYGSDFLITPPTEEDARKMLETFRYTPDVDADLLIIELLVNDAAMAAGITERKMRMDLTTAIDDIPEGGARLIKGAQLADLLPTLDAPFFIIDQTRDRWIMPVGRHLISFANDPNDMIREMRAAPYIGNFLDPLMRSYENAEANGGDASAYFDTPQIAAVEANMGPFAELLEAKIRRQLEP